MSKFIRINEGIDLLRKYGDKYIVKDSDYTCEITVDEETLLKNYKVADTIEELFMPNDLLIVGDDKNQMPIFIESIEYLRAWLYCHDIYKIKEFYIKNGNDFKCVAKLNDKGDLELI